MHNRFTALHRGRSRRVSEISSIDEGVGEYLNYPASRVFLSVFIGSLLGCAMGYGIYNLVVSYQTQFGSFLSVTNFSDINAQGPGAREITQRENNDFSPLMGPISDSGRGKC